MRALTVLLLALASLCFAGCERGTGTAAFENTDITGLGYARDFALVDAAGKPRRLADFKGKAVVVFFGYTQCPDVCPTTMSDMAAAMKALGPQADKVQVVFITLDPERDTPALLAQYVPAFDPRFIGLTGTPAEVDAAAQEFRVFHQKVQGKEPGSYTIDHLAGSYIFDPQGKVRLFVRYGQKPAAVAHDLKILLS